MKPLIFLVLSRDGLACKYGKISQILIYSGMQNCIFWYHCVAFSYFQDQLTTYRLSELFSTSQMVCHIMSWEQYHSVGYLRQKIRRESFFFNWDSLYARLNSHYKAWSYKNKKHKKIKAYRKFL